MNPISSFSKPQVTFQGAYRYWSDVDIDVRIPRIATLMGTMISVLDQEALRSDMPMRGAVFIVDGKLVGFTADDALNVARKLAVLPGYPTARDVEELQQEGKIHTEFINPRFPNEDPEATDIIKAYLAELGKTVDDLEKIKVEPKLLLDFRA